MSTLLNVSNTRLKSKQNTYSMKEKQSDPSLESPLRNQMSHERYKKVRNSLPSEFDNFFEDCHCINPGTAHACASRRSRRESLGILNPMFMELDPQEHSTLDDLKQMISKYNLILNEIIGNEISDLYVSESKGLKAEYDVFDLLNSPPSIRDDYLFCPNDLKEELLFPAFSKISSDEAIENMNAKEARITLLKPQGKTEKSSEEYKEIQLEISKRTYIKYEQKLSHTALGDFIKSPEIPSKHAEFSLNSHFNNKEIEHSELFDNLFPKRENNHFFIRSKTLETPRISYGQNFNMAEFNNWEVHDGGDQYPNERRSSWPAIDNSKVFDKLLEKSADNPNFFSSNPKIKSTISSFQERETLLNEDISFTDLNTFTTKVDITNVSLDQNINSIQKCSSKEVYDSSFHDEEPTDDEQRMKHEDENVAAFGNNISSQQTGARRKSYINQNIGSKMSSMISFRSYSVSSSASEIAEKQDYTSQYQLLSEDDSFDDSYIESNPPDASAFLPNAPLSFPASPQETRDKSSRMLKQNPYGNFPIASSAFLSSSVSGSSPSTSLSNLTSFASSTSADSSDLSSMSSSTSSDSSDLEDLIF